MDELIIHATSLTPLIHLNPNGVLLIEGRSIPNNAKKIYKQAMVWSKKFLESPPGKIIIRFKFEFCDSSTLKNVFELLQTYREEQNRSKFNLEVEWFYENGDEEILDQGEYLMKHCKIPFTLISYKA